MLVKARIVIQLKKGILDVQGSAVRRALEGLGFSELRDLKVGKVIDVEVESPDPEVGRRRVEEMCQRLLANPVIEDFAVECPLP
jgi:phosphoribosylformylglycinamidine synthase PurS subunit